MAAPHCKLWARTPLLPASAAGWTAIPCMLVPCGGASVSHRSSSGQAVGWCFHASCCSLHDAQAHVAAPSSVHAVGWLLSMHAAVHDHGDGPCCWRHGPCCEVFLQAHAPETRCSRAEGHLLHFPSRALSATSAAEAKGWSCTVRAIPSSSLQVLHIDRNNYYGGQSASLNLNQVCTSSLCTACLSCCCTASTDCSTASSLLQLPTAHASRAAMHQALCIHECHLQQI